MMETLLKCLFLVLFGFIVKLIRVAMEDSKRKQQRGSDDESANNNDKETGA